MGLHIDREMKNQDGSQRRHLRAQNKEAFAGVADRDLDGAIFICTRAAGGADMRTDFHFEKAGRADEGAFDRLSEEAAMVTVMLLLFARSTLDFMRRTAPRL